MLHTILEWCDAPIIGQRHLTHPLFRHRRGNNNKYAFLLSFAASVSMANHYQTQASELFRDNATTVVRIPKVQLG